MTKQKNWMLTIWGLNIPFTELTLMAHLEVAHLQLEITSTGVLHWQCFCQFDKQVTKTSLIQHFQKLDRNCHIGQSKNAPTIKTVKQGLQYVSGYGPLALRKLHHPEERYVVRDGMFSHVPLPRDQYERWRQDHQDVFSAALYAKNHYIRDRMVLAAQKMYARRNEPFPWQEQIDLNKHDLHDKNRQ